MRTGYVYFICNTIDDRIYVGSTVQMRERRNSHINCLHRNKHPNKYLQNFVSKYGFDSIYFEVVYEGIDYIKVEQMYIDDTNLNLFNLSKEATFPTGNWNKKHTKESKQKLSESMRGSKCHNSKLTEEKVVQIKNLLKQGLTQIAIAKMFGVADNTICEINRGNAWTHVPGEAGKKRPNCKLTKEDVITIKHKFKTNTSLKEIAQEYGVNKTAIQKIYYGINWKHITVN